MKKLSISVITIVFLSLSLTVFAEKPDEKKRKDPFACVGEAAALGKEMSTREIYSEISKRIKTLILKPKDAYSLCVIAELMKRAGDYRAEDYYKKAIDADDTEPAYELFYADYLRNFRGPQRPLFPEAEEHYYQALSKLEKLEQEKNWQNFDNETRKRVERGLITLYQEDGFPLAYWKSNITDSGTFLERPFVFFSTINKYGRSTTDFDEVDDARDFTSEALFASSQKRLNRALTEDELTKIIRTKEQFEILNRFRFRYRYWPTLDIFYKYREIEDAQITNFFEPNKFNDVNLNEYGVTLEKPFNFSPVFDLFLKGTFNRIEREGIVEFLPDRKEDIDHFEANTTISRFFGPDKANLEFVYVFQDIDSDIPDPPKRDRRIFATTVTYQLNRPISIIQPNLEVVYGKRFEIRGIDLFGGVVYDKERFGHVNVEKNDFFIGASIKGLGAFDVTARSTVLTSEVEGDKSQDNSQYRTNLTLLYRIIDEEKGPGIPKKVLGIHPAFLHLVIPLRHDIAIDGPKDFENFRVDIELDAKFFSTEFRGTTFLVSARYGYQRFYRLNNDLNLFSLNMSMGF